MVYVVESEVNEYSGRDCISFAQEHAEFFAIISENVEDTEWINMNFVVDGAPASCNIAELNAMLTEKELAGVIG
jgi:hypothetical protein